MQTVHDAETLTRGPFPRRAPPIARPHTLPMPRKQKPHTEPPAPAPKMQEHRTLEEPAI